MENNDSTLRSDQATILPSGMLLPPISQLPAELLVSVLHPALPLVEFTATEGAYTMQKYMRMVFTIRRVAKRWQEVVDGTPSFWTFVLSTLPPHVNNATITRSANLPLAIIYDSPGEQSMRHHPSSEEFLETITQTRTRWSTVVLDSCEDTCISEYLAAPAPLLQTVVVRSSWFSSEVLEPLDLLGGQTTNLRYVEISDSSIQWKIGDLTRLKVLELGRINHNLTAGHIVDFLGSSPYLEKLAIEGELALASSQSSSPTIFLPYLRSLELECDDSNATDYVLRHIRTPACLKFTVCLGGEEDEDEDYARFMNETLYPFREVLRTIHIKNGASEMTINHFGFSWRSTAVDGNVGFEISTGAFYLPGILWVGQTLEEEPGLRVCFPYNPVLNDAVLENIAPLCCVTRLLVAVASGEDVRELLQFLTRPLSPSASPPALPCLRELLIVSTGWDAQDLLDMVQLRFSVFSQAGLDPPLLSIRMRRGAFKWNGSPRPILDLIKLVKIRETEGVERVKFVGEDGTEGTLAITWSEEACEPTWG